MTEFDAVYYDGRTSAKSAVRARVVGHEVHVAGDSLRAELPLAGARVDPPLAGVTRAIRFANGAQLRTDDVAALDAVFPTQSRVERFAYALEAHWRYALAGLGLVAAVTAWLIMYGLPFGAMLVAGLIPEATERAMGDQALRTIDRTLCTRSGLDAKRREALAGDFGALTAGIGETKPRLELRACRGIGPNAFALPGGIIVVTDQLTDVLKSDAQLTAVLAHELGHVHYRHPVRAALQSAGAAALMSALAGDAVSITSIVVMVPTLLLQTGYSRGFEDDADTYAFERMKALGISPRVFAEALTALEASRASRTAESTRQSIPDYLSTHPSSERRIQRALSVQ